MSSMASQNDGTAIRTEAMIRMRMRPREPRVMRLSNQYWKRFRKGKPFRQVLLSFFMGILL